MPFRFPFGSKKKRKARSKAPLCAQGDGGLGFLHSSLHRATEGNARVRIEVRVSSASL